MRKFCESWHKVDEILFPGYVFAVTNQPDKLYQELGKIFRLTRILGGEGQHFIPLTDREEEMVRRMGDQEHKTSLSRIEVVEGEQSAGKRLRVIEGPLKIMWEIL